MLMSHLCTTRISSVSLCEVPHAFFIVFGCLCTEYCGLTIILIKYYTIISFNGFLVSFVYHNWNRILALSKGAILTLGHMCLEGIFSCVAKC